MAIFKRKPKTKEPDPIQEKKEKTENLKKSEIKKEPTAWRALSFPYISEKATDLTEEDKYVFVIKDKANKNQVKKAVEELYKINVLKVNIVKIPRKKKRLGKYHGWKKGFKKAIVQVKKGQKIDIYPT